jgi:hypothetical protein
MLRKLLLPVAVVAALLIVAAQPSTAKADVVVGVSPGYYTPWYAHPFYGPPAVAVGVGPVTFGFGTFIPGYGYYHPRYGYYYDRGWHEHPANWHGAYHDHGWHGGRHR